MSSPSALSLPPTSPKPLADAEGVVPAAGVRLDGVVEVVADQGAVSQLQRHPVAVHEGAVEARDDPLHGDIQLEVILILIVHYH